MRSTLSVLSALIVVLLWSVGHTQAVTFDWATIGNAGNAADSTGYGAVSYEYRIATTEVTNAQYAEFLNAVAATDTFGLYNTRMAGNFGGISRSGSSGSYTYAAQAGRENNPVTYVSWYDSIRFINWLHNGQGSGDTETGAYTLLGGTATPSNAATITRDTGASYFVPSEDEWYKAAYHDATAGTAGTYFTYATGSNSIPVSDQPGDDPSAVNYFNNDGIANGFNDGYVGTGSTSFPSSTNPLTDVGAYTDADSPYGTFDQNGNVWEWNEALAGSSRGLRGGSWFNLAAILRSSDRANSNPSFESEDFGFRVASPVPEPASALLLTIGSALLLRRHSRLTTRHSTGG